MFAGTVLIQTFALFLIIFQVHYSECYSDHPRDNDFIKLGRRELFRVYQTSQNMDKENITKKYQNLIPKSVPFFCDVNNGPGRRSSVRPTSINRVRPGDIDVIAGMGDSLTVGNGIASNTFFELPIENRGIVWSIGGQADWRKYTTLPNILKVFNPKLYGYALKNSLSAQRASRFNVAEGAAESRDMLYQAKVLKMRLENDPNVNMTHDWKMVTMFFGSIDLCIYSCHDKDLIQNHERDMLKVLRYMRDNIPKLFVNIVSVPSPRQVTKLNKTPLCNIVYTVACSCYALNSKHKIELVDNIYKEWQKKEQEVMSREEFHTEEFTVIIHPFIKELTLPIFPDGRVDMTFFTADCFHFTQKVHAILSIHLWNSLLTPEHQKFTNIQLDRKPICPTEARPFIATLKNSRTEL